MTHTGKVVLGSVSVLVITIAAALLTATVALGVLVAGEDADGFVHSRDVSVSSDGYAITTESIDFGSIPEDWVPDRFLGTFRVEVQPSGDSPVFIGIGPSSEVDAYLEDVARSEVTHLGRSHRATYVQHRGSRIPEPPTSRTFWAAHSVDTGEQTFDWEPDPGTWTLVIMNSDASPGVDLTASAAVNSPWILVALVVVGGIGIAATAVGVALAIVALRRRRPTQVDVVETPQLTRTPS